MNKATTDLQPLPVPADGAPAPETNLTYEKNGVVVDLGSTRSETVCAVMRALMGTRVRDPELLRHLAAAKEGEQK